MELIWDFAFKSISEETKTLLRIFLNNWPVSVLNRWLFPKAFQLWTETYTSSLKTRAHKRLKRDTLRRWQDKTKTLKPNHSGSISSKALRFKISSSKQRQVKMSSKSSWNPLCGLQVRLFQLYKTTHRNSCFQAMTQTPRSMNKQKFMRTYSGVPEEHRDLTLFCSAPRNPSHKFLKTKVFIHVLWFLVFTMESYLSVLL